VDKGDIMKNIFLAILISSSAFAAEDGASLYKKCSACHGASAEKQALGKSEVINSWNADKIETALMDYKAGTRNTKGMGALMKGQVAQMNESQIKMLAKHIVSLKK